MKDLMKYISFTKNETKVILFIVTILVAGFSIKYYKQVISNDGNTPYDFSGSDSEFNRLSDNIKKNSSSKEKNNNLSKSEPEQTNKTERPDDSVAGSIIHEEKKPDNIPGKLLNINAATKNELIDLPGVGESTAEKIIIYRNTKKGFRNTEELMNVSGIGKKKYEKIKNYIKVE